MKDCPLTLCTEAGTEIQLLVFPLNLLNSKLKNYELLFPRCRCQQWEGFVSGLRNVAKYFVSTPSDSHITPDRGQGTLTCA